MELADDEERASRLTRHVPPRTLRSELKRRERLPPEECLRAGLELAQALAHLHGDGLIHRDIKPSNIIFVQGAPRLADIGLVTDLKATRSFVGTEGYMPPEGPGMPQADLYSLGKVLYEISTGGDRLEYPELPTALRNPRGTETAGGTQRGHRQGLRAGSEAPLSLGPGNAQRPAPAGSGPFAAERARAATAMGNHEPGVSRRGSGRAPALGFGTVSSTGSRPCSRMISTAPL